MPLRQRRRSGVRWVHPDSHEIVKFLPKNPPTKGDHVLVDGERHKVLACPVAWDGLTWKMTERGIKVTPDPLTQRMVHMEPTPGERFEAWKREDPEELRRAADEYESLGHQAYADHLRRWADGDRSGPYVVDPLR